MSSTQDTERKAFRRTDDYTPGTPKLKLVTEPLALPLTPVSVLIKVHAVSLNYRDANISNDGNPWPVIPNGITCNDAAGEVIAVGEHVKDIKVGDRVALGTDSKYITDRSPGRSWLVADEGGVLATRVISDEEILSKLHPYLGWESACLIPCAGVTAWSAMRGVGIGKSVLIQGKSTYFGWYSLNLPPTEGTGGVSSWALKLARASGLQPAPAIATVTYKINPNWR